jgi:hypothetical protein
MESCSRSCQREPKVQFWVRSCHLMSIKANLGVVFVNLLDGEIIIKVI